MSSQTRGTPRRGAEVRASPACMHTRVPTPARTPPPCRLHMHTYTCYTCTSHAQVHVHVHVHVHAHVHVCTRVAWRSCSSRGWSAGRRSEATQPASRASTCATSDGGTHGGMCRVTSHAAPGGRSAPSARLITAHHIGSVLGGQVSQVGGTRGERPSSWLGRSHILPLGRRACSGRRGNACRCGSSRPPLRARWRQRRAPPAG